MAGESKTTADQAEIRRWVEARGGPPAGVRGTGDDQDAGLRRIDFPGGAGEDRLAPVSWEVHQHRTNIRILLIQFQLFPYRYSDLFCLS